MTEPGRAGLSVAERLGAALLTLTGAAKPPVPLVNLATILGARAVRFQPDLIEDGRVVWQEGGPVIELRRPRTQTERARQRFTLAHEIAHLALAHPDRIGMVARRVPTLSPSAEESFCDSVAAALLMPRNWMIQSSRSEPISLNLLRSLGGLANVSMSACAARLAELGRTSMLLRWRRAADGRWILAGMAGVPRRYVGTIGLPDGTQREVERGGRDRWFDATLEIGGEQRPVRGQLDGTRNFCLMLVTKH